MHYFRPYQSPYGGPGGNRTHVQHAFAWKELQQYFYLSVANE